MNDEEILKKLSELARDEERAHTGSPWTLLTTGELSDAKRAELEAEAEATPEGRRALDAHRPLDEDARARIAARLAQRVPAARASTTAQVRRLTPNRILAWAAPLALAAGLVFWLGQTRARFDALPEYAMVVQGSDRAMRGPAEPSGTLAAGDADGRFEIVARPATRIDGALEAKAFTWRDGALSPLKASVEVSDEGAVRVVGTRDALQDVHEVRIVIGRPEVLVDESAALERASQTAAEHPGGWLLLRVAVE